MRRRQNWLPDINDGARVLETARVMFCIDPAQFSLKLKFFCYSECNVHINNTFKGLNSTQKARIGTKISAIIAPTSFNGAVS